MRENTTNCKGNRYKIVTLIINIKMENKNLIESTALKALNIVAIGIDIFAIVDLFVSALNPNVTVVF